MVAKLKHILEELHISISELEPKLEIIFKRKSYKFYQRKFSNAIREMRILKLRLEKEVQSIKDSDLDYSIKNIISLLEKLIEQTPLIKEEVLELIDELHIKLQEINLFLEDMDEDLESIYDLGSHFDFYLDIKEIINQATQNVFIIDSWIDGDLLEVYLKKVNPLLNMRILTNSNNGKGNFLKIGNIFKSQYKNFETRESPNIHDRAIFCDDGDKGWVMGQSIKDAAKNKPTYLIKLKNPRKLNNIYDKIWNISKKIL